MCTSLRIPPNGRNKSPCKRETLQVRSRRSYTYLRTDTETGPIVLLVPHQNTFHSLTVVKFYYKFRCGFVLTASNVHNRRRECLQGTVVTQKVKECSRQLDFVGVLDLRDGVLDRFAVFFNRRRRTLLKEVVIFHELGWWWIVLPVQGLVKPLNMHWFHRRSIEICIFQGRNKSCSVEQGIGWGLTAPLDRHGDAKFGLSQVLSQRMSYVAPV